MGITVKELLEFIKQHPEIDIEKRIGCWYDNEHGFGVVKGLKVEDRELTAILES